MIIKLNGWNVEGNTIRCTIPGHSNRVIDNDEISCKKKIGTEQVWDWPIHFSEKTWTTKKNIAGLMQAMAIQRNRMGLLPQEDIDENTWAEVLKVFSGHYDIDFI